MNTIGRDRALVDILTHPEAAIIVVVDKGCGFPSCSVSGTHGSDEYDIARKMVKLYENVDITCK